MGTGAELQRVKDKKVDSKVKIHSESLRKGREPKPNGREFKTGGGLNNR